MQPELDERLLRESRTAVPDPDPAAMRCGIVELLARSERAARRRRRPLVAAVAAGVVLAAALAAVAGERAADALRPSATPAAAVDRTFACRLQPGMPLRIATSPLREIWTGGPNDPLRVPAFLAVGSGSPRSAWPFLVVRPVFFRDQRMASSPAVGPPGVYVAGARCTPSQARVELSRRGIAGYPVTYEKTLNCQVSGRVLVRVRARLAQPTRWGRADATYSGAQRRVLEAWVAVRSERPAGPVAFIRMRGMAASTWYGNRCS